MRYAKEKEMFVLIIRENIESTFQMRYIGVTNFTIDLQF